MRLEKMTKNNKHNYSRVDIRTYLGLELLDQTPAQKREKSYRPTKERLHHLLNNEIVKFSQKVGVTLTFKKDFITLDPISLHRYVELKLIRSSIWNKLNYILYPEYTKAGNLHYHGLIYNCYDTEAIRAVKWWRRTFGYVKPELEIRHYDKWSEYITKDIGKVGLWALVSDNTTLSIEGAQAPPSQ